MLGERIKKVLESLLGFEFKYAKPNQMHEWRRAGSSDTLSNSVSIQAAELC